MTFTELRDLYPGIKRWRYRPDPAERHVEIGTPALIQAEYRGQIVTMRVARQRPCPYSGAPIADGVARIDGELVRGSIRLYPYRALSFAPHIIGQPA